MLSGCQPHQSQDYRQNPAVCLYNTVPQAGRKYSSAGQDTLQLIVAGNDEQFTVTALFDNLGKGASGAAIQNMNLLLGLPQATGLNV